MAWTVELDRRADKDLARLDRQDARRILKFLSERIATRDDPRSIGSALKGTQPGELWRYRVGDHRVVCEIQDEALVVLVIRIGHRREIYR